MHISRMSFAAQLRITYISFDTPENTLCRLFLLSQIACNETSSLPPAFCNLHQSHRDLMEYFCQDLLRFELKYFRRTSRWSFDFFWQAFQSPAFPPAASVCPQKMIELGEAARCWIWSSLSFAEIDFCIDSNAPSSVIQQNTDTCANTDANIGCSLGEIDFFINGNAASSVIQRNTDTDADTDANIGCSLHQRQMQVETLSQIISTPTELYQIFAPSLINAANFLSKGPVRREDWQFIR